jgi:hypothetical protein|nr:MAG TPA: hypothetical protein [Caudoviricetes sp.]
MSVVDNAIQQLFKNGCKIKKLWTNASITSSFTAQDVRANTTGCDGVMVTFRRTSSSDAAPSGTAIVMNYGGGDQILIEYAATMLFRDVVWNSRSKITLSDCQRVMQYAVTGSRQKENALIIPVAIYGIQLLGGGNT